MSGAVVRLYKGTYVVLVAKKDVQRLRLGRSQMTSYGPGHAFPDQTRSEPQMIYVPLPQITLT